MYIVVAVVLITAVIFFKCKRRKEEIQTAQGLQVWNNSGKTVLNTNDYTFKALGSGNTGTSNGSISNSAITANTIVIPCNKIPTASTVGGMAAMMYAQTPVFTVSSGRISWAFTQSQSTNLKCSVKFLYGEWR